MNVNKNHKRIRRSAEESKRLILDTAATRLREMGLDGLTVNGVARAAGISHGTVIHHFGTTEDMRDALLDRLTQALLTDIHSALQQDRAPKDILADLFTTLSSGGHGPLLAWRALNHADESLPESQSAALFNDILDDLANETVHRQEAKMIVLLVAAAAMGLSICGSPLTQLIGLSEAERAAFPDWLARLVQASG